MTTAVSLTSRVKASPVISSTSHNKTGRRRPHIGLVVSYYPMSSAGDCWPTVLNAKAFDDGGDPEVPGWEVNILPSMDGAAVAKRPVELAEVVARLEELEKKVGSPTGPPRGDLPAVTPTGADSADVEPTNVGDDQEEELPTSKKKKKKCSMICASPNSRMRGVSDATLKNSQKIIGSQVALLKSFKHMHGSKHKLGHTAEVEDKDLAERKFLRDALASAIQIEVDSPSVYTI
jgi:hypothetical protein